MRSLAYSLVLVIACGHNPGSGGPGGGPDAGVVAASDDPLAGLPTGTTQWTALCAKHYGDMISAKFCAGTTPPTLTSLADLEALLGLTVSATGTNPNVRATFAGESTGLGIRTVNSLLPRAFLMTPAVTGGNPQYQVLAFSRGEPLVELVANDPVARTLRFFLVRFHPSCEPTCNHADLQTATIESGWTSYTLYDDATIANTTLDCLNCHQPSGPASAKILRMQELQNPWQHWFYPERPLTLQVVQDFQTAHPTEDYAGVPYSLVYGTRPAALTSLVQGNGFATQPNAFDTLTIDGELTASGASATWQALYAKSVAGQEIAVPYFTNAYDPAKVQAATASYLQVASGAVPRDQLVDLGDLFLDSVLPDMSIAPATGLDGHGILVHMCRTCHNASLDQTISRANFSIDTLAQLPRAEKDLAIARMMLPDTDRHHMPPTRFHVLSTAERDLAIQELSK